MTLKIDRRGLLAGVTALAIAPVAVAQVQPAPLGVRRGRTSVRGKTVAWTAETGETVMRNAAGAPRATIFSVAYMAEGAPVATRPVSFVWNGGPGGATWHLREHLSPRITEASRTAPGYAFVDNVNSVIDETDLVFIDAPGTGFSRVDPSAKTEYWGIEEDGRAFSDFIHGWLSSHGRLGSPVYLIGESYGGTRAGQVVRNLAEKGVELTGVALVAPSLGTTGAGLPSARRAGSRYAIPPEACVAWYYKKGAHTGKTVDEVAKAAEAFAAGPFAAAIAKGAGLGEAEKNAVATELSGFIGLPVEQILKADLFVSGADFRTDLMPGRTLGGADGRGWRATPPPGQTLSVVNPDEGYDITASIEGLVREDLGYKAVGAYGRDPGEIGRTWNNKTVRPADTDQILKERMGANPKLRVLLVAGYFDTIVPYPMPMEALTKALPADRFQARVYATGHAVYEDMGLRPKTTADLAAWYAGRRI